MGTKGLDEKLHTNQIKGLVISLGFKNYNLYYIILQTLQSKCHFSDRKLKTQLFLSDCSKHAMV